MFCSRPAYFTHFYNLSRLKLEKGLTKKELSCLDINNVSRTHEEELAKLILTSKVRMSSVEFFRACNVVVSNHSGSDKMVQRVNLISHLIRVPDITDEICQDQEVKDVLKRVIEGGNYHLFNPVNKRELKEKLIKELGKKDASLLTKKVNAYFKDGFYGLENLGLAREIKWRERKERFLEKKLSAVCPFYFLKLYREDLAFMENQVFAKYVRETFNLLAKHNSLGLLFQTTEEIYPGQMCEVHPLLRNIRTRFENKTYRTFESIVPYLKALANRNLGTLKEYYYKSKIDGLQQGIVFYDNEIKRNEIESMKGKEIASMVSHDIRHGDFKFVNDNNRRNILRKAYETMEKFKAWKMFNEGFRNGKDYLTCVDPIYKIVTDELDERGLTSSEIGYVMWRMRDVHENGWNKFVLKFIESEHNKQGVVSQMQIQYKRLLG